MRNSHIWLYGVAAATVAVVALAPVGAQDAMAPDSMAPEMMEPEDTMGDLTPEQEAERDRWPTEQQTAYDAWPDDTKDYYWTLPRARQDIFWRLRDDDKVALTRMNGERQEASWKALEERLVNPPGEM
jgi:hypothetical protein